MGSWVSFMGTWMDFNELECCWLHLKICEMTHTLLGHVLLYVLLKVKASAPYPEQLKGVLQAKVFFLAIYLYV